MRTAKRWSTSTPSDPIEFFPETEEARSPSLVCGLSLFWAGDIAKYAPGHNALSTTTSRSCQRIRRRCVANRLSQLNEMIGVGVVASLWKRVRT